MDKVKADSLIRSVCIKVEPDQYWSEQLYNYTELVMLKNDTLNEKYICNALFKRQSFVECGLVILDQCFWDQYSYIDYSSDYLKDYSLFYIRYCSDDDAVYELIDRLLEKDNCIGMVHFWKNEADDAYSQCDYSRLNHYKDFVDRAISNQRYYDLELLLIIAYYNDNRNEVNHLSEILLNVEKLHRKTTQLLQRLKSNKKITFEEYIYSDDFN